MLDIAFDVSLLVINKADFIYQAFKASSENKIQICIKKLLYQNCTRHYQINRSALIACKFQGIQPLKKDITTSLLSEI
jgi:putative protein kinase ArgK-like GTPase of G3E family